MASRKMHITLQTVAREGFADAWVTEIRVITPEYPDGELTDFTVYTPEDED